LPEFQTTIEIRKHFELGEEGLGSANEALVHWRKAREIDPTRAGATFGVAWLLATAPEATLRNGSEAVQLAEGASDSAPDNAKALDILAASRAEDGQFARASATAARALE
jgi:cytochrome c-type biogenesis protein CcmH/NrfG